ncbi:11754_t:CDS:1, partial [Scutellospora calospora]
SKIYKISNSENKPSFFLNKTNSKIFNSKNKLLFKCPKLNDFF